MRVLGVANMLGGEACRWKGTRPSVIGERKRSAEVTSTP
jgi:hypothetical protein